MTAGDRLHVVVPGSIRQRTGGYIYDARMVDGLRGLGWPVVVHELEGRFPDADDRAQASLSRTLARIDDGARVIIDGLAMGGLPGPVGANGGRLRILSLVHHLLSDETGLPADQRDRLLNLEREALAACIGVVVTSPYTASRLQEVGVASNRVRSVVPGVDRPRLEGGPPAEDGVAEVGEPRLLCVASLIPRKGHDTLVRALGQLRELPWRCVCAGSLDRDSVHSARVKRQTTELGIEHRVEFAGECDEATLGVLYRGSDLFVLPSHFEGYGMVLAEALVHGLPVVATTAGAIPDTVPADAGLLVAPGDPDALAGALATLLGDPARLARLAAAARRRAQAVPTWEQSVGSFAAAVTALAPLP